MKDYKLKCTLCRARHRSRFMLEFPDKNVCHDCASEYRKIFFNFKNRDTRRTTELQLPKEIKDYYNQLLLGEKSDGISEDS